MSKHERKSKQGKAPKKKDGIHKDWRAWTAVVLMLGAMVVYVLSDDEALQPGGVSEQGTTETGQSDGE
jgi:hypothetical protein